MKRREALAFRAQIERDGARMTDAEACNNRLHFPAWCYGCSYAAGVRVRFAGALYRCVQAHISTREWSPEVVPALWARVLPGQEDTPVGEWVQPDSTNPYQKGDRVTFDGKTWESTIDNNVWAPGVYGWTIVG